MCGLTFQALRKLVSEHPPIKELEITKLLDLHSKLPINFLASLVVAIDEQLDGSHVFEMHEPNLIRLFRRRLLFECQFIFVRLTV